MNDLPNTDHGQTPDMALPIFLGQHAWNSARIVVPSTGDPAQDNATTIFVPSPGSIALMGIGLAVAFWGRKRGKSSR